MKLPRPQSSSILFEYYGYIIAPDQDEAREMFDKPEYQNKGKSAFKKQLSLEDQHLNPFTNQNDKKLQYQGEIEGASPFG
mmetsp:Transcript_40153/g.38657  ORF Transcript_40153/g.38657 Transcript_40153/m.38657 type:complete len:80 (-) Transcript_40153:1559-1798(-)